MGVGDGYAMIFGWYLISQMFYSTGFFALTFALFRLKYFKSYFWETFVFNLLCITLAYFIHKEHSIGFLVNIVSIVLIFFFLTLVTKIPLFWAIIVTATGNLAAFILQSSIMVCSFGFFYPMALKEQIWKNYALSTFSGIIIYIIAVLLYRRGFGFSFDFEKVRFKWEKYIVINFALLTTFTFPILVMVHKTPNVYIASSIFILEFFALIFYAFKKEKDEYKSNY